MIDEHKLIMSLNDWWYSSFALEETEESKAIKTVIDKVEKYVEQAEQRSVAEDIVESFGFNADSYRQAKAKTEPQTDCGDFADRPQGEWIVNISEYKSVCSVCGTSEADFIYGTEMWYGLGESKFCPNCGARMKGASDERWKL